MYFWKYRLKKLWLDKCLKGSVLEDLLQPTKQMGRNSVAIRIAEPLEYLLITVKVVVLEKVSFSDTKYPKAVC